MKKRIRTDRIDSLLRDDIDSDSDPLAGVANLLDVGLVFIVGLIVSLFTAYHLEDLLDQKSKMTVVKQSESGEMEIITKDGLKLEAVKVTRQEAEGKGVRLGVAYKLEDGTMIYLPD